MWERLAKWIDKRRVATPKLLSATTRMEIQSQSDYSQDYPPNVDNLLIKFIKKGDNEMAEVKYKILSYDGDNFECEKAVVENVKSSKTEIANLEARMEQILAHITEEKEEVAQIVAQIEELKKIAEIAEKEAKEAEEKARLEAEAKANENATNE